MIPLRYSRQIALPEWGEIGQQRMSAAAALIVGLGGLGNPAATCLASAGIGRLILNDFDTVDESNLSRQPLFRSADVGRLKVEAAADSLRAINSDCRIDLIDRRLTVADLARSAQHCAVVIDASDNFATRFAVNEACLSARVALVSGAAIRYQGQLAVFRTDHRGGPCYRCFNDENAELLGDCESQGVLSPLTGMVGAALALEAMRLVVGFGRSTAGTVAIYDARVGEWRRIRLVARPSCPACGEQ